MALKHGVLRDGDGTYNFYWLGNRLSLEEFNEQIYRTVTSLKGEIQALAEGMDMGQHFDSAKESLAKLEQTERILALPLCEACRRMVGG